MRSDQHCSVYSRESSSYHRQSRPEQLSFGCHLRGQVVPQSISWPHGKSSALRLQEVVGTDESALDAVVAADMELMELRAEEADIQNRLGAVSLEDGPEVNPEDPPPEASTSAANDADNDRLAAIYDRLAVC